MDTANSIAHAAKPSAPLFGRFRRWLIEIELTEWRWPGDPGPVELLDSYLAAGGTEAQFRDKLAEGADEDEGIDDDL